MPAATITCYCPALSPPASGSRPRPRRIDSGAAIPMLADPFWESGMPEPARVALLVTCLVDLFRPSVGFAAVKLLEEAGCTVEVPRAQTCCGQPAYNSGDRADAKAIARQVIAAFAGYDYVVAPSGSCAGMVKVHYPELFADEPAILAQAQELASRTYELVAFLVDVRGIDKVAARWPRR